MARAIDLLLSRTVGAALVLGGLFGWLESTRPPRTVIQELDRELGWVILPSQSHFDRHLKIPEVINQWGFRGKEWTPEPAAGVTRIAILGSSMTYGSSVQFEDLYTSRVESQLSAAGERVEVLNCGVQGYTISQAVKCYELKVRPLRPKVVVYALVDQDVKAAEFHGVPPRGDLRPWITRTEFYRRTQYEWQDKLKKAAPENPKPGWLSAQQTEKLLKTNDLLANNPFAPEMMPLWEEAGRQLERFREAVRADGASFVVTVLPQRPQALNPQFVGPELVVRKALAGKDGAYYVDAIRPIQEALTPLREKLRAASPSEAGAIYRNAGEAHGKDLYQVDDRNDLGHFAERGMEVIAAALSQGLRPLVKASSAR